MTRLASSPPASSAPRSQIQHPRSHRSPGSGCSTRCPRPISDVAPGYRRDTWPRSPAPVGACSIRPSRGSRASAPGAARAGSRRCPPHQQTIRNVVQKTRWIGLLGEAAPAANGGANQVQPILGASDCRRRAAAAPPPSLLVHQTSGCAQDAVVQPGDKHRPEFKPLRRMQVNSVGALISSLMVSWSETRATFSRKSSKRTRRVVHRKAAATPARFPSGLPFSTLVDYFL